MDVLKRLFEQHFRCTAERVIPVQGELGASGRQIVRLKAGPYSAVGVLYSVREENQAFLSFSRHFRSRGLPVPEIYAEDLNAGAYLEEDLGSTTLFEYLGLHRQGVSIELEAKEAYQKAIAFLPRFQIEAAAGLDYSVCYPRAAFDRQSISWDLNYFKYYFLRLAGVAFNEQALEDDFTRLTDFLLTAKSDYFLYRDFQSRNVMLRDGEPYFIDYQGGRKGALQYDVASLLFDAKADLPPAMRQLLLDHYLDCLSQYIPVERASFISHFYAFVYVRIMQAMGAYGYRGFFERKTSFLASVPYALKNLAWLEENVELPIKLPELMKALKAVAGSEKLKDLAAPQGGLTVRISSFSFHREPPVDPSGNGGGFIFDARSLPNPGRQGQFRRLTGKDASVIEYLEQEESVRQYLSSVFALVDSSVAEYRRRGFTSLMVSFGCTGGQHRSVYLAEQLARRLRYVDGVDVELRHIELEKMGR
jgi:aminoglycoside/choline kinase family phosphotransferase